MIGSYLRDLASEYLQICQIMESGEYDGMQLTSLSAQRTWLHDEMIRLLGPEYDRPYDMKAYCRQLVNDAA